MRENPIFTERKLIAAPLAAMAVPENARAVGLLMFESSWSRRCFPDNILLRFEYFLDHGGEIYHFNGEVFDVTKDCEGRKISCDGCFSCLFNDPGFKWITDFPSRCVKAPLSRAPSKNVQKRLQIIELGLRTPRMGYAP